MLPKHRLLPLLLLSLVPAAIAVGCGTDGSLFDGEPVDTTSDASSTGGPPPIGGDASVPDANNNSSNGGPGAGCGNGFVDPGERCDDGNTTAGDGCSADCKDVEIGYLCPKQGAACFTRCGDGLVMGDEVCDDGNTVSGDGCSDSCQFERGYACDVPGEPCTLTQCGDGQVKGLEQCDDGNTVPYDGCFECQFEPVCNGDGCIAVCGDGIIYPGEQCDDGNRRSGDGCSATCVPEPGFQITTVTEAPPNELVLPTLYRDFKSPYADNAATQTPFTEPLNGAGGHPDFEHFLGTKFPGSVPNLVNDRLGDDGKPVYNAATNGALCEVGETFEKCQMMTGPSEFHEWYHDDNGLQGAARVQRSMAVVSTLTLGPVAGQPGTYQFDGSQPPYAPFSFFPLDNAGYGIQNGRVCRAVPLEDGAPVGFAPVECFGYDAEGDAPFYLSNTKHNFSFTTELHNIFTYVDPGNDVSGPKLEFSGDDDVWIFINGRRVVDLGALHAIETEDYTLTRANATALGMVPGGVYDVALFHAERRSTASNFKFTLSGFVKSKTVATPICGDGIKTATETCDDGENLGGYGQCAPGCVWGPRCGDGIVQPEFEQCDDQNLEPDDGCTPRCQFGDRDPVN